MFDGRSILEVDLTAMADKPWRRPGSDISDWFNYGFDEISWEAYCYRRRELGDMASVLKANVIVRYNCPHSQRIFSKFFFLCLIEFDWYGRRPNNSSTTRIPTDGHVKYNNHDE